MDSSSPKYLLVEDHIRRQIKQRKIIDKLPGERNLAKTLGFSYMTIRKAIENLVAEGVLYKIPTRGTYVALPTMQKSRTGTIGYFLDERIAGGLSSPYYSLIFHALEKATTREGYSLMYFTDTNAPNLNKVLNKLDGVVVSCFQRIEGVIQNIKQHVPVVAIDNGSADKTIPSVIVDNFNAKIESVDYLCSLGHQRIGYMTGLEDSDAGRNRFQGYQTGLVKNGIDPDPSLVFRGNYTFGSGRGGVDYFLTISQKPTAIICANDSMALGAINRAREAGLKVPDDVSIVGFDDIQIASEITPSLTTISVPVNEIATKAFNLLQSLIEGKPLENQHIALPAHLVPRQSCARPMNAIIAA